MKKIMCAIVVGAIFFGCSSSKKNKDEEIERSVEDIVITKSSKKDHSKSQKHKKEIEKDRKDFYYALKDKNINTDTTKKNYTRVDAQKNVKNKDDKNVVEERSAKKIDTPYNYIRIDLLKSALSKDFIVHCSSCHDDYANGIIGPSLLHKNGAYIYQKLIEYKTKEEANILMQDLVNNMSKKRLKVLADEIANFNKEIRKMDKEK